MHQFRLILTWLVLLTIVAGLGANTVAFAQDSDETAAPLGGELAAYFPKDTLLYASLGTSPAEFERLNSYLARIEAALPADESGADDMRPLRVETVLDELVAELTGGDFDTDVRPWWGDEMAVGILSPDFLFDDDYVNDDLVPGLLAIAITDRAAAADFVETMLTDSYIDWTRTEDAGVTTFTVESYDVNGFVEVHDDLLIAAPSVDYLPIDGQPASPNLTDSNYFVDTLALLPGSDYSSVLYADTPMLVANLVGTMDEEEMDPEERFMVNLMLRMVGPTALGLTEVDGGVLVADVAQPLGNMTGFEALGMTFDPMPVADPTFMENLPASAALVAQGTSLAQILESSLEAGQTLVDQFLGPEMDVEGLDPQALLLLNLADIALANLSGFSYPRDLRPWMTGDYAIFAGLNADFTMNAQIEASNFPVDVGMVFETEDADATRNFVTMLARELRLFLRLQGARGVHIDTMVVDGVDMMTADISDDGMRIVQLVVAANDDLIVFGTRGAVDSVLFADSPRFDADLPELLDDASMILYAAPPTLEPAVDWLLMGMGAPSGTASGETTDPADQVRAILNVIQYATISVESTPEGGNILRATLRFE